MLVVDDDELNREVALRQLALLGVKSDAAVSGAEALRKLGDEPVDVILMDCEMPLLDCFATTAEIRKREGAARHTWIIAMTANAMQGDREQCISAGMDDYISKPIRVEELVQSLNQCQSSSKNSEAVPLAEEFSPSRELGNPHSLSAQPLNPLSSIEAIDTKVLQALRQAMGSDADQFLTQLINVYLEETPLLLQSIGTAISQTDSATMQQAAHTLKSSSASLGAITLSKLCEQLESLGRSQATAQATELVAQIEPEYERVKAALQIIGVNS